MNLEANFSYPTSIRFGAGRISEIADACAAAGVSKPLLVTDRGLAEMEITTKTLDLLEAAGLGRGLFAEVDPNPNEKNLTSGVKAFNEGGHDGVIAFGGGSGLDLGKMVAFMAGQTRSIWDFEDIGDWWTRANAAAIVPIRASHARNGSAKDRNTYGSTKTRCASITGRRPTSAPRLSINVCNPGKNAVWGIRSGR